MIAVTIAVIWVIGGFIIYSLYSKSRAVATEDEILVFEEEQPHPDSGQFKVMLAVANPASTLALVKNTYRICSRKNAALELLHMVPVPEAVALSDADRYKFAGKEGIMEIMLYLEGHFKINTTLRYCRNIARGIVSALREKRIKMLIMGWHGKPQGGLFTIGSTVDPVIERAYCDVVIMKNCQDGEYKNILVPVAGGPNSALALETACLLADEQNTRVTLFSVVNDRFKYDPALLVRKCEELAIPLDHITSRTVFSDKVEETILKEASEYDLVVIGASRKGALSHVFHGSLPEQIAAKCHKPLVMVSASRGIGSWLKKWF
jgi:nucleotide-binding universal stress UspA family protein